MNKWWQAISPREQRLLLRLLPVAALLLLLVLVRPIWSAASSAQMRLDLALDDIAWLQVQSPRLMENHCRGLASDTGAEGEDAVSLARRFGVQLTPDSTSAGGPGLAMSAANGNQLLTFLRAMACRGNPVQALELETLDSAGQVRGTAVFSLL